MRSRRTRSSGYETQPEQLLLHLFWGEQLVDKAQEGAGGEPNLKHVGNGGQYTRHRVGEEHAQRYLVQPADAGQVEKVGIAE